MGTDKKFTCMSLRTKFRKRRFLFVWIRKSQWCDHVLNCFDFSTSATERKKKRESQSTGSYRAIPIIVDVSFQISIDQDLMINALVQIYPHFLAI